MRSSMEDHALSTRKDRINAAEAAHTILACCQCYALVLLEKKRQRYFVLISADKQEKGMQVSN